jgi:hypothetical protein
MTHKAIDQVVTILSLFAPVGLQAACASDSGSSAGTGGAPGMGGTLGGNSGGTAGSQPLIVGSGTPRPCTASETVVAPADGLIADFKDPDVGINFVGGHMLAYPIGSPTAPNYTTVGGSLHITLNRPATSVPQYLGVIVGAEPKCVDATAFDGVQFLISGSLSGCTMRYYANDDAHQDDTTGALHASGPAGSYPPQTTIRPSQVTSTAQILRMPFDGQSGGSPATPVDPARLIFFGWQFDVDASSSGAQAPCIADLTIDDVRLY